MNTDQTGQERLPKSPKLKNQKTYRGSTRMSADQNGNKVSPPGAVAPRELSQDQQHEIVTICNDRPKAKSQKPRAKSQEPRAKSLCQLPIAIC
jgi:hypothetical protein